MSQIEFYAKKVNELMPHHASDLMFGIDEHTSLDHVEDIVFSRSEYLGGMAAVLVAIVKVES